MTDRVLCLNNTAQMQRKKSQKHKTHEIASLVLNCEMPTIRFVNILRRQSVWTRKSADILGKTHNFCWTLSSKKCISGGTETVVEVKR